MDGERECADRLVMYHAMHECVADE